MLQILIRVILVTYLCILIHEFGHLVCGFMTGFKFDSFTIGPLHYYKKNGTLKFKLSKDRLFGGQCLMIANMDIRKFNPFWYSLGGIFFNILTVLSALLISMISGMNNFLEGLIAISLTFAIINLIPIKSLTNDGYLIFKMIQCEVTRRGMYAMLRIEDELKKGKKFSDFDQVLFNVDENTHINNVFIACLIIYQSAYLYEIGDHTASMKVLDRIELKKLPYLVRCEVKTEKLYHYLVYEQHLENAKQLFQDKELERFLMQESAKAKRVASAYSYLVLEDKERGLSLLNEAVLLAHKLPTWQRNIEIASIQETKKKLALWR